MRTILFSLLVVLACAGDLSLPPNRIWGDVTADGRITVEDVDAVVRHAVGFSISPFDTLPGDVDADSVVSTRDALIIRSYLDGLDVSAFRVGQVMP